MSNIIVPGRSVEMKMSLSAFKKIAEYILRNDKMRPGDKFTITGTDKSTLTFLLEP